MRVGIVGCGGHRTGGWGHPPLRNVTNLVRRGRCPQRPGIPPAALRPSPPFTRGGCCYASSGSLVKGSWHGAAVTEGFRTPANPPHPSWASPMPPSPLRGEGYSRSVGSAQMSMAFPSSVMAAPCHLPPGEGERAVGPHFPCFFSWSGRLFYGKGVAFFRN